MEAVERIVAGLNPAQREAALATRGPVVILAGAGTGKTTTVTHRIAVQVASGAFAARAHPRRHVHGEGGRRAEVAAGRPRRRREWRRARSTPPRCRSSAASGSGTPARALPEILDSKAPLIASLANGLPPPHKFMPRGELAGEIEWAKNRMIVARRLPGRPRARGPRAADPRRADARDLRRLRAAEGANRAASTSRTCWGSPSACSTSIRRRPTRSARRHHAFTVDEYQDVNPLQQALLEAWLGGRDDVCVVGDDYQTIYAFTGASPRYLHRVPRALPGRTRRAAAGELPIHAADPRRRERADAGARRLREDADAPRCPTARTRRRGRAPTLRRRSRSSSARSAGCGTRACRWRRWPSCTASTPARSRTKRPSPRPASPTRCATARSCAGPDPRSVMARLRKASGGVAEAVEAVTDALGYDPDGLARGRRGGDAAGGPRAAAVARRRVRRRLARGATSPPSSPSWPRGSPSSGTGRGVNLLTYHRSKGLEFDAVFLPRLLAGELPFKRGRAEADPAEERRLLYVGITRARRSLFLSWPREAKSSPSPFLRELGVSSPAPTAAQAKARAKVSIPAGDGPLFDRLKEWRRGRAKADGVPAYVVFPDARSPPSPTRARATGRTCPPSAASAPRSSTSTRTRSCRSSRPAERTDHPCVCVHRSFCSTHRFGCHCAISARAQYEGGVITQSTFA